MSDIAARRPRQNGAFLIVLTILMVLVIGAPSLLYPFARDQGEYAYIAAAALDGKVIYREVFNVKPPLTHLVHMAALLAFGHSMLAIRILDLLWQAATAVVILLIATRMYGNRRVSLLAPGIYAGLYYLFDFWDTAQTDGFLTLPSALAVLAFLIAVERDNAWAYYAAGAALGVAVLFKYPIGVLLPVFGLLALRRAKLYRIVQMGVGFLVPVIACALELAREGALHDFLLIQLQYIPEYTAGRGSDGYAVDVIGKLLLVQWHNFLVWLSVPAVAIALIDSRGRPIARQVTLVALWWLAALISLAIQNKGTPYHALPMLAPVSIIGAHLAAMALRHGPACWPLRLSAGMMIELTLMIILGANWARPYPCSHQALLQVASGRRSLTAIYEDEAFVVEHGAGVYSARAALHAAEFIKANSRPGDTVFVWGFEPSVYFLSQRACASRFIYNYPLYGDFAWAGFRQDLLGELEAAKPRYIVVVRNDPIPWVTGTRQDSRTALADFHELKSIINDDYRFVAIVEHYTLYRRKSPSAR